jgi:hypothetical protein
LVQVIGPDEAAARSNFYAKHDIAYVGRPAANRRGTFKKASNLNYQLAISQLVAMRMKQQPGLTAEEALEVVWEQWGREFVAQGDLTMDDDCLILLIDADTKVCVTFLVTTCYMCTGHGPKCRLQQPGWGPVSNSRS